MNTHQPGSESGNEARTQTFGEQLRDRIIEAGVHAAEGIHLDSVEAEKMASFNRIQNALPAGALRDIHEKFRGIAKVEARALDAVSRAHDFAWNIVSAVVTAEAPVAAVIPHDVYSRMQALSIKTGSEAVAFGIRQNVRTADAIIGFITHIIPQKAPTAAPAGA
jgi:hypothetical protein